MNSIYFEMMRDFRNTTKNVRSFFGLRSTAMARDIQRNVACGMSEKDCWTIVDTAHALRDQIGF